MGIRELVIVGSGEPTFGKNYAEIIRPVISAAQERGIGTVMFTTAVGITEEQARFFCDNDVTVIVSLDSLDPKTYAEMMGLKYKDDGSPRSGQPNITVLPKILEKIAILRRVYGEKPEPTSHGSQVVRLGINVTVQGANVDELERIKEYANGDMEFIANPPMQEGRIVDDDDFRRLVGERGLEHLQQRAAGVSDTGGHSSIAGGVCSYFIRGLSMETDGALKFCGYDSQSYSLGNVRDGLLTEDLLKIYRDKRAAYNAWCEKHSIAPSCPNRTSSSDTDADSFSKFLQEWIETHQQE